MAQWVPTSWGWIPENAIRAGYEEDGRPLYVARARIEGVMTPGKAGPHLPGACIPYYDKEHIFEKYEILVLPAGSSGFYQYEPVHASRRVPENALKTDDNDHGFSVYVGRFYHRGSLIPGKIVPDLCAYGPYRGEEVSSDAYEYLVKIK